MHISHLISGRQMFIHASLMTTCLVAITKREPYFKSMIPLLFLSNRNRYVDVFPFTRFFHVFIELFVLFQVVLRNCEIADV